MRSRFLLAVMVILTLFLYLETGNAAVVTPDFPGETDRSPATPGFSSREVCFAAIGDFGQDGQPEADIARLVHSWNPEFIITLGDNNYPSGSAKTIDGNIGKHYHDYIGNYQGGYGPGADLNRFFPALGNHDWQSPGGLPYLDYFTLLGNERYYDFTWGSVQIFALDSDEQEPDGITAASPQAARLHDRLGKSSARWKLVTLHHAPYSSGWHGSQADLQWPYKAWGADAVLAGHDHHYERIVRDDLLYLVNGLGGNPVIYPFFSPIDGSLVRFSDDFGALLIEAGYIQIRFLFITRTGEVVDDFTLSKPAMLFLPVIQ
jgi:hypothetical protein